MSTAAWLVVHVAHHNTCLIVCLSVFFCCLFVCLFVCLFLHVGQFVISRYT